MPNVSLKEWKDVIDINLTGSFFTAQSCIARMLKNKVDESGARGVVIMISSIMGTDGSNTGMAAYSASKGAINGLTLPMAREVGKDGIRVCSIAPGVIYSHIHEELFKINPAFKDLMKEYQDATPMGRYGSGE